jgi:hypothetical protein
MFAALLAPLVVAAGLAEPSDAPVRRLPPTNVGQPTAGETGRWRPRRVASRQPALPGQPYQWPVGPSATENAFSGLAYRLPADPLPADGDGHGVLPATYPRILTEPLLENVPEPPAPCQMSDYKDGFFQKLSFTTTWIARPNDDDVGATDLQLYAMFGLPLPTRNMPLVITPLFTVYFLDGPSDPQYDLPPRIYDAEIEFRWVPKIGDQWLFDVAVSPGFHSDFEHLDNDSFRITGRIVGVWIWRDRLKLILGVMYLNRDDVPFLPVAGLIWTPTDDWNVELLCPRPRIARRLFYTCDREDWLYLGGELGGGAWSVQRANLTQDTLITRDYRIFIGIERKRPGGAGAKFEAGWVFGRQYEYESNPQEYNADATVMLRGVIAY